MWQYTYTDELYHHGIKGMKWGRRRFQTKDGSLTPAGMKRYAKLQRQLDKTTASEDRYREKTLDARERHRARLNAKYERKIARSERRGDETRAKKLAGEKKDKIKDFDAGTAATEKAFKIRKENLTDFTKAKMTAISDPSFKKSSQYKKAKKFFKTQKFADSYYGKDYNTLMETSYVLRNNGVSWTRGRMGK